MPDTISIVPWLLESFADCPRRAAFLQWGIPPSAKGGGQVNSSEIVRAIVRSAVTNSGRPGIEEVLGCSYHDTMSELAGYVTREVNKCIGGRTVTYNATQGMYSLAHVETSIRRDIQNALLSLQSKWWAADVLSGSSVFHDDELTEGLVVRSKAHEFEDSRGITRTLYVDVVKHWEDLFSLSPLISPSAFDRTDEVHLLNVLEMPESREPWARVFTLDRHQVDMYQIVRTNAANQAMDAYHSQVQGATTGADAFSHVPCNTRSADCNNWKCPLFEQGCVEAAEVRRSVV